MSNLKPYNRLENPYNKLSFFKFLVLSTAMILFFPWSILFCLIFLGVEQTKLIFLALVEDIGKTILGALMALIVVILIIIGSIKYFFIMWNQPEPEEPKKVNSHGYEIILKVNDINQSRKLIDISDYIS
ncbi:MAG: hypothetical protein CMD50_06155 [Gammaproteobacteria bacterium]|nr:hypothetical protein [Gammaproteobacteria bacterium]